METQPQPTPFDIPPIPFFAYVPPASAWLILGGILLLIFLLYRIAPRLSLPRSKIKAFMLAKSEIEKIASRSEVSKDLLERAGSVVKILISAIAPKNSALKQIREMSPSEFDKLAQGNSESVKALLADLKEMSLLSYQPDSELMNYTPEIFRRLLNNLRLYEDEWTLVTRGKR